MSFLKLFQIAVGALFLLSTQLGTPAHAQRIDCPEILGFQHCYQNPDGTISVLDRELVVNGVPIPQTKPRIILGSDIALLQPNFGQRLLTRSIERINEQYFQQGLKHSLDATALIAKYQVRALDKILDAGVTNAGTDAAFGQIGSLATGSTDPTKIGHVLEATAKLVVETIAAEYVNDYLARRYAQSSLAVRLGGGGYVFLAWEVGTLAGIVAVSAYEIANDPLPTTVPDTFKAHELGMVSQFCRNGSFAHAEHPEAFHSIGNGRVEVRLGLAACSDWAVDRHPFCNKTGCILRVLQIEPNGLDFTRIEQRYELEDEWNDPSKSYLGAARFVLRKRVSEHRNAPDTSQAGSVPTSPTPRLPPIPTRRPEQMTPPAAEVSGRNVTDEVKERFGLDEASLEQRRREAEARAAALREQHKAEQERRLQECYARHTGFSRTVLCDNGFR